MNEFLKMLGFNSAKEYSMSCSGYSSGSVITFKKENNVWYIDLPKWPFAKSALAMVDGASRLLDKFSGGEDKVSVKVHIADHEKNFPGYIQLKRTGYTLTGGADYVTDAVDEVVWLCPVTLYVMWQYPEYIYVKLVK